MYILAIKHFVCNLVSVIVREISSKVKKIVFVVIVIVVIQTASIEIGHCQPTCVTVYDRNDHVHI